MLTMFLWSAEQMSLFAQSMPFMTVPGNHERDCEPQPPL